MKKLLITIFFIVIGYKTFAISVLANLVYQEYSDTIRIKRKIIKEDNKKKIFRS